MPTPILDFDALAQAISGRTVLCIGDIMLDEFVYGEVSRISPEAPAPVISAQRSEIYIGGAGNVARNIASSARAASSSASSARTMRAGGSPRRWRSTPASTAFW